MQTVVTQYRNLARWDVKSFLLFSNIGTDHVRLGALLRKKQNQWNGTDDAPMLSLHFGGEFSQRESNQIKGQLFVADKGDLVYSKIDLRNGAIGIIPSQYSRALFTAEFPIYEIDTAVIHPVYLQLYLQSSAFKNLINSIVSGASGRKRVKPSDFENLFVRVPAMKIQEGIVNDWNKAQMEVQGLRKSASDLEIGIDLFVLGELGIELKAAQKNDGAFVVHFSDLERWGVDFNTINAKTARNIKGKYGSKKLFEITRATCGGKWGDEKPTKNSTVLKILRATNFDGINNINLSNIAERAIKTSEIPDFVLKKGDIIVEKSGGGEKTPVGRVAFIDLDIHYGYSNFLQKISIIEGVNPKFVYITLGTYHSVGFTKYLQMNTTGLRNLIMEDYWNVNIPIPPLLKQNEIVAKVEIIKKRIIDIQNHVIDKLQSAKADIEKVLI
ncbi:MAG: restriction endonuclease subunit S [Candidatus Paceibacterota bacterium]